MAGISLLVGMGCLRAINIGERNHEIFTLVDKLCNVLDPFESTIKLSLPWLSQHELCISRVFGKNIEFMDKIIFTYIH